VRIIAGRLKGRRLAAVRGAIRPTADRVREAIFNILGPIVLEAQVLDLFAGTGALGIEALSRGAARAVFVENHASSLQVLRQNLAQCGLTDVSQVLPQDAARALATLAAQGERFGLIFLDPPYGKGLPGQILPLVARNNLLAQEGLVVVEHRRGEEMADNYQHLARRDERGYGDTVISLYEHQPETSGQS
jgi:16S rRNA (guanine(966)-N(2))-methyltransferase RsmD